MKKCYDCLAAGEEGLHGIWWECMRSIYEDASLRRLEKYEEATDNVFAMKSERIRVN
jgi:hypothetical protein